MAFGQGLCAVWCAFFPFDWQQAEEWCRWLNRDPADVRYRALPRGDGRAYRGWLKDDWQDFPLAQAKGYGLYAVPNLGGDKAADITSCQSLFVEWDDIPIREQTQGQKRLVCLIQRFASQPVGKVSIASGRWSSRSQLNAGVR